MSLNTSIRYHCAPSWHALIKPLSLCNCRVPVMNGVCEVADGGSRYTDGAHRNAMLIPGRLARCCGQNQCRCSRHGSRSHTRAGSAMWRGYVCAAQIAVPPCGWRPTLIYASAELHPCTSLRCAWRYEAGVALWCCSAAREMRLP